MNVDRLMASLLGESGECARVLVVGGGTVGWGMEPLY